jgi:hypothetical protein
LADLGDVCHGGHCGTSQYTPHMPSMETSSTRASSTSSFSVVTCGSDMGLLLRWVGDADDDHEM